MKALSLKWSTGPNRVPFDATSSVESEQHREHVRFKRKSSERQLLCAASAMTEETDSEYDHANRAFLQAFIARSILTFDEAKPIIASILGVRGRYSLASHWHF